MPVEIANTLLLEVRVVVSRCVRARGRLRVRGRRWVLPAAAAGANIGLGRPNKVFGRYLRTCKGMAEAVLMHPPPPKRGVDVRACRGGEVWLHGSVPTRCDVGLLA